MNSRYSSESPNLPSVTRFTVRPCGPFRILPPGAGLADSRVGPSNRSHRMAAVVNQSLALAPSPCQPARSLPLSKGVQPSSRRYGGSPCASPSFSSGLGCACSESAAIRQTIGKNINVSLRHGVHPRPDNGDLIGCGDHFKITALQCAHLDHLMQEHV